MIDVVLRKIFGTKHERDVKRIMPTVVASNAFEPSVRALGDAELQAKTDEFRKRLEEDVETGVAGHGRRVSAGPRGTFNP